MTLESCYECDQEVSDQALLCPSCGVPFEKDPQLSQKLKRHKMYSVGMMLTSLPMFFTIAPLAISFIFVGLPWYLLTRLRMWWNRKQT